MSLPNYDGGFLAARCRGRDRYTSVACFECQRRKQKCSGDRVCAVCQKRGVGCVYPDGSERRKRRKESTPNANTNSVTQVDKGQPETAPQNLAQRVHQLESLLRNINELSNEFVHPSTEPVVFTRNDTAWKLIPQRRKRQEMATSAESPVSIEEGSEDCGQLASDDLAQPEIFEENWPVSGSLSLHGALSGARKLLNTDPLRDRQLNETKLDDLIPLPLPDISQAQRLLDICSERLGTFIPLIAGDLAENGLLKQIMSLSTSQQSSVVLVRRSDMVLISQLYVFLALGSCLEHSYGTQQYITKAWSFYNQGLRVVNQMPSKASIAVELAKFHLLRATYLMQAESLQSAMEAIWASTCFAMQAKLNDESYWRGICIGQVTSMKRLWWSIYFMERRIAEKCGKPYVIRDEEVQVDGFKCLEAPGISSSTSTDYNATHTDQFLQVLVNLGRLWGKVWDMDFRRPVSRSATWEDVEIMDVRIIHLQRNLPAWLQVREDEAQGYPRDFESDLQNQRRLVIHTRLNLLRMLLRQNPANSPKWIPDAGRFCNQRAMILVRSIKLFISHHSAEEIQHMAYFIAYSLGECVYHVTKVLAGPDLESEWATANETLAQIVHVLQQMESTSRTAQRVLNSLDMASTVPGSGAVPNETIADGDVGPARLSLEGRSSHILFDAPWSSSNTQHLSDFTTGFETFSQPGSLLFETDLPPNVDSAAGITDMENQFGMGDLFSQEYIDGSNTNDWTA